MFFSPSDTDKVLHLRYKNLLWSQCYFLDVFLLKVSSSSCLKFHPAGALCKVCMASFIPLANTAGKGPTSPSVLICRKWLCVNSKCHVLIFHINVNTETACEGPNWVTTTSPAVLRENSCRQADFTAKSAAPICETDLKVNFFWLADYQTMQRYGDTS